MVRASPLSSSSSVSAPRRLTPGASFCAIDVHRHGLRPAQLHLLPRRPQLSGRVRGQGGGEWRHLNRHPLQGRRRLGRRKGRPLQAAQAGSEQAHRHRRQPRRSSMTAPDPPFRAFGRIFVFENESVSSNNPSHLIFHGRLPTSLQLHLRIWPGTRTPQVPFTLELDYHLHRFGIAP